VRKPRRVPESELQPYMWTVPLALRGRWGVLPHEADSETSPTPLDWATLFSNPNPVEIEVGFGKGMFLLNAALAQPGTNYFGIEIIRKYQLLATTRIATRRLPNVKTCAADAKLVLRDYVTPGSVQSVHVYFPDPWWKNRHEKRKLFTPEFAQLIAQVLHPAGILYFVSDVADYFAMVTELLASMPEFAPREPVPPSPAQNDQDYLTNFERKFRKEGRPIYRSRYERLPGSSA
jgi:tRNA (guanine-N7-)-methyltransferase